MHRLTARLLLTLMLVGTFAPLALAITAPASHACCMRKPMHEHGQRPTELGSPATQCQHDCCHAVTGIRIAQLKPSTVGSVVPVSSHLPLQTESIRPINRVRSSRSVRAPPQFSIA